MWRALDALYLEAPKAVVDDVRKKVILAFEPRRIPPQQLEALSEAHFATSQGVRLSGDHRLALWELLQRLRKEVAP